VYLFWVYKTKYVKRTDFPPALVSLLCNEKIRKVGSNIQVDVKNLKDDFGIEVKGAVPLAPLCKQAGFIKTARASLLKMCIVVLGRRLDKDEGSARFSKWSRESLTTKQKEYAARDAKASREVFCKVIGRAFSAPFGSISLDVDPGPSPTSSHATLSPRDDRPLTRVLLDPFHAMKRILDAAPKLHPVRHLFVNAIRDAIFMINPEDRQLVSEYLATKNLEFNDVYHSNPDSIMKFLRRWIPGPEQLERRLQAAIDTFKHPRFNDPETGRSIVVEAVEEELANLLKHVQKGCLSDPARMNLYFQVGTSNGLPRYRCIRGTNDVEGSVHSKLVKKLTMWNAGPRLGNCVLAILRDRHNIRASEKYRDGFPKVGHYAHWLLDDLRALSQRVYGEPAFTWWPVTTTSPNPNEAFGIAPCFPPGHADYEEKVDMIRIKKYTPSIQYLAITTRATIPFLPVRSKEECRLYKTAISRYIPHGATRSTAIDFETFASDWNQGHLLFAGQRISPDGRTIMKKLAEHLKSHFNTYFRNLFARSITRINANSIRTLWEVFHDTSDVPENDMAPNIPIGVTHTCSVEQSLLWSAEASVTSLALAAIGEATEIQISAADIQRIAAGVSGSSRRAESVVDAVLARVAYEAHHEEVLQSVTPAVVQQISLSPAPAPAAPMAIAPRPTPTALEPQVVPERSNDPVSVVSPSDQQVLAIIPSRYRPILPLQFMPPSQAVVLAPESSTSLPISSTRTLVAASGRSNRTCQDCGRTRREHPVHGKCEGGLSSRTCSHLGNPLPGYPRQRKSNNRTVNAPQTNRVVAPTEPN
jgi:hypothetical protein